ncbi:hypothetical protein AALP_AA6G358600, partial [Arabis alpina]
VGLQYLSGDLSGGNARCIAMLQAFQEVVKDYTTPPQKNLNRNMTAKISSYVSFLVECRPLSISMGNAIRFVKNRIAKLPITLAESEAKAVLQSDIERFINEKIIVADKVGTACVAMVASAFRVPVLVCCEAYKFHERVQLDSICSNELGDPNAISKVDGREDINYLDGLTNNANLQFLNLRYDATPSDYISMIITDYGMVPPTSVPVIVREYQKEHLLV